MTAIWVYAHSARYSLGEFGDLPFQSLATLNHNSLNSAVLYVVSFAALFILYAGALWIVRQRPSRHMWAVIVGGAVVMNVVMLPLYPLDATDIYDYIVRGRMTAYYGLNPMKDVPAQIPLADPIKRFASWQQATSAYGPAWEVIAAITARAAGNDRDTNVIAFKLVSIAGYLLTLLFLSLALVKIAPEQAQFGAVLFAWHPLMIYFAGGTGHNDMLMIMCVAASLLLVAHERYTGAIAAAVLGALIKFIPFLMIPFVLIVIWQRTPMRQRLRIYGTSALIGVALTGLLFAPFWAGIETLAIDRRGRLFTSSAGTIARQILTPSLGEDAAGGVVNIVALGLFALFYAWQCAEFARVRPLSLLTRLKGKAAIYDDTAPPAVMAGAGSPAEAVARMFLRVLLFYLMVAAIWFQHWYLAWLLPLAALLSDTPTRRLTLWFSYLVTWQPLIYNYVTLRYDGWMPLPWRDLLPVSVFMGLAWLYVAIYWARRWARHFQCGTMKLTES